MKITKIDNKTGERKVVFNKSIVPFLIVLIVIFVIRIVLSLILFVLI